MLEAHQKQAAFALALDIEDVPRFCRRKDHAPLGIRCRNRHGGIIPPNPDERKMPYSPISGHSAIESSELTTCMPAAAKRSSDASACGVKSKR